MSEYVGHPFEHPIIYLNSIKNIIGDDKKTPSKILLDSLDKVSNSIPKREDDQKIFFSIKFVIMLPLCVIYFFDSRWA